MIIQTITAWFYFGAWRILRWLPENFAYASAYRLADFVTKKNGKSVQRLRSNLARTQKDITELDLELLLYKAVRSSARYWCDTFRLPDWSKQRIQDTVTATNEYLLLDAISSNNGGVVTVAHSGNYDHASAYFCSKGGRIVTVAERLKPEALFKKFMSYREAYGMESLPIDGRVIPTLLQRIRQGGIVALAADRDLSRSGIDVTFFDGTARMPAGPALLAIRTGVPLIYAGISYTETGIHIDFELVPIAMTGSENERVAATVQNSADLFAKGIARYPHDWHMMQRIWIDGDFKERE
jgi:KDO2-lipid IV(A) lauroyltransferase